MWINNVCIFAYEDDAVSEKLKACFTWFLFVLAVSFIGFFAVSPLFSVTLLMSIPMVWVALWPNALAQLNYKNNKSHILIGFIYFLACVECLLVSAFIALGDWGADNSYSYIFSIVCIACMLRVLNAVLNKIYV